MTASFCKRNSADNEEINHYLTHLLKQDMIPFEEGGGLESCHMITRSINITHCCFELRHMIFVQMNFYIIFQTVLINLFEVGFFFKKKDASWFSSQINKIRK